MTVIKSFQCDICFTPCTTPGSATLLLSPTTPRGAKYTITSRVSTLKDTMPEDGQRVRHLCPTCVGVISCKTPPAAHAPVADKRPKGCPPWEKYKEDTSAPAPHGKENNNNG